MYGYYVSKACKVPLKPLQEVLKSITGKSTLLRVKSLISEFPEYREDIERKVAGIFGS